MNWKVYAAVLLSFVVIDLAWILLVVAEFYTETLGDRMRETPAGGGEFVFYLGYTAGIAWLAVKPALDAGSLKLALGNGALLGALAYGTYTLTNYTILEGWTLGLVGSDIAWGVFLTMVTSAIGFLVGKRGS